VAPDITLSLLHVKRKRPSSSLCQSDAVFSMLIYGYRTSLTVINCYLSCYLYSCTNWLSLFRALNIFSQRVIDHKLLAKHEALAGHLRVRRPTKPLIYKHTSIQVQSGNFFLGQERCDTKLLGVISFRNEQCIYCKVLLACLLYLVSLG